MQPEMFPAPIERYLAEIRAGASEDAALAAADADRVALERWSRNKAFRVARKEALGEATAGTDGEEWVLTAQWGSTELWAPRRPALAAGVKPERVPFPPRGQSVRPWQRRRTMFSQTPPSGVGL